MSGARGRGDDAAHLQSTPESWRLGGVCARIKQFEDVVVIK